jgi:hypothetical protein
MGWYRVLLISMLGACTLMAPVCPTAAQTDDEQRSPRAKETKKGQKAEEGNSVVILPWPEKPNVPATCAPHFEGVWGVSGRQRDNRAAYSGTVTMRYSGGFLFVEVQIPGTYMGDYLWVGWCVTPSQFVLRQTNAIGSPYGTARGELLDDGWRVQAFWTSNWVQYEDIWKRE